MPLAIAIGCQLAKTMCTSRAWRNVLAAAYPDGRVRWRPIYAAYIAGVGVNAVFPREAATSSASTSHTGRSRAARTPRRSSSSFVLAIVDLALLARALRVGADAGTVFPSLDVLSVAAELRLRLVPPPRRDLAVLLVIAVFGLIALAHLDPNHTGDWSAPASGRRSRSSARPPAGCARWSPGSSPTGRSASRRSGSCSTPSGSTSRSARAARPGAAEPRDARAGQPGRYRHRAGASSSTRSGTRATPRRRCWRSASA